MRFVFIFMLACCLALPSFAGEREDVTKCISAAKRYADISLIRGSYQYDGGWFSSEISWHGKTKAYCELGSEVRKLVISGKTYIVDGYAGEQALLVVEKKEKELEMLRKRMASYEQQYEQKLTSLKTQLKRPKPSLDEIEESFIEDTAFITLRVLGTLQQLEANFSGEVASRKLRAEIQNLTTKNRELADELRKSQIQKNSNVSTESQQLLDQIATLEKDLSLQRETFEKEEKLLKSARAQLENIRRTTEIEIAALTEKHDYVLANLNAKITEQKQELVGLNAKVLRLENELAGYNKPVAPIIENILAEIREEKFNSAYRSILDLRELPLYEPTTNKVFIEAALNVVRPIASSEHERNLAAYKFLLKLDPESTKYLEKVNSYEQKIIDSKEKEQLEEIVALISSSDDLSRYRSKMAKAALQLIQTGKCSKQQIKDDNGGWWKSGERKGQYFMDCGRQRVWFNPKSKSAIYEDKAVSENRASQMCQDAIRREALTSPNFHYFDTSYTVHHPRKAVTYIQGFDVKNAFGAKLKYRAFCRIQPSGQFEMFLERK